MINQSKRRPEDFFIRKLLKDIKIKEIMTRPVISIKVDALFSEVAEKITQKKLRHLPVVDKNNKLVGLITQRDLYKISPPRKLEDGSWYYDKDELNNFILEKVMIPQPFSMKPDDSVGEAVLNMVQLKYGCVPVVFKNNVLCGIITQLDILKLAAQIYKE